MSEPRSTFRRRAPWPASRGRRVALAAVAGAASILGTGVGLPLAAQASTVSSATFTGGTGTVSVNGTLYARSGGALTLTVNTSSDTQCVEVSGAFSAKQTSSSGKSLWTFGFTAGTGDGVQTVTAMALSNVNKNNDCTGQPASQSASFVLDNTGPVVTAAVSPTPNAAGWNNSNVSITWSATDAGSGVGSGPTPATDSQTANTAGVTKTATATDRLGNVGTGSVTVKLDKTAPLITGSRSPAANANGWNNTDVTASFTCSDNVSGIKSCSGPSTLTTSAANQSVTGTAVDNADNTSSATVTGINIDKVPPTLTGIPTTSPNAAGWYNGDVTVHWTAADALSGLAGTAPADSTISSEGNGLTASASVADLAGNTTNATSTAVNIDKTPPNTTATAPSDWNNTDVTVALNASDALSGVAATHYQLDGGAEQTGTSVPISSEGVHTLSFWSVDKAGNTEAAKSVQVKIDKTAPTINHSQSPAVNGNGWDNGPVTVTFTCADALSGIASCTGPQTVSTDGQNQPVTGTATDNAGNTATDPATVSIDTVPPTISAARDVPANGNGWNNTPVTVTFTCADALSGIDTCPAPKTFTAGADQSVTGTAKDAAGNTADATVTKVNVDTTAPTLSGAATTAPNGDGWYSTDVTVHWTCADDLSGIDGACPADSSLIGEGGNLSASATVADLAGNSTTATTSGIRIDRTAPVTAIQVNGTGPSTGWYLKAPQITLTGLDALSGVARTDYAVDGGPFQPYTGPFTFDQGGSHSLTWFSTDNAGNAEASQTITIKVDNIPPTISGSQAPLANGYGWNNGPVTVTFNCSDAESGIASCSPPVTVSGEGRGQSVDGVATDNAGNTASTSVSGINIDATAPDLSGAATTAPNAAGWYNGDVTVHWTGVDGLSGIDPTTQPGDSLITGEGDNLGAGPVSISDLAGNVATASINGIKIDRTAPSIAGMPTTAANAAGWYSGPVTVHFDCADNLSGVASCADDAVLSQQGANQSATGQAMDKAGNTARATVSGINIDAAAPVSTAVTQCTATNGWCTGTSAMVKVTATDNLSGVKEIHYSVNGGTDQAVAGSEADVNVPLNGSGQATIGYYAVDNAGNAEQPNSATVQYDNIPPTVTHTLTPPANAGGWNSSDVTVNFTAVDDGSGSGLDQSSVTGPVTISAETAGTVVTGSAKDLAGNVGTDQATVKLDKTPPSVSGAITSGTKGTNGWYISPVRVGFSCSDALSGVGSCPQSIDLLSDGAGQQATGTGFDLAGNSATATVSGINIDTVPPTFTALSYSPGAQYTLGAVPPASCTGTDVTSGIASCSVTVTGPAGGVGTFSYTATATDQAGNVATSTGQFTVVYRFDGFLQPINDTAHQIGTSVSIFKAGSTVPVKLQLKTADGTVVKGSAPVFVGPVKGSPTTAAVNETAYTDTATTGSDFSWDPTDQQWIYTWSTKGLTAGYYYRIGALLDDGTTVTVSVGLR